jgi:predicted AlkP superfamily phosphohydrolase/phosphomutase
VDAFATQTDGDDGLYLLSDHGFAEIKQEVYLNVWLEREGYLRFETSSPKDLTEISATSRAFTMDPNRIYLNLKDKYPKGSVDPSEKQDLKKELAEKLKSLEYSGQKVVRDVFDTVEIYSGPHVASGPDLIVLSEYGFDMKGSVKKKEIFGRSNLQGMHTWDDAFFWANSEKGEDLSISDLSGIIMENFS